MVVFANVFTVRTSGTGSTNIYGTDTFADENFDLRHETAGLLSMAVSVEPCLFVCLVMLMSLYRMLARTQMDVSSSSRSRRLHS